MSVDVVVVFLVLAHLSTHSVGEEMLPLGLNPRPRSRCRRWWFVLSPISLRSGDTAVRVFQDPYQPMMI